MGFSKSDFSRLFVLPCCIYNWGEGRIFWEISDNWIDIKVAFRTEGNFNPAEGGGGVRSGFTFHHGDIVAIMRAIVGQ